MQTISNPAVDEVDEPTTEGRTGLDGQPLTDDEHRAMHHRTDGTCVFGECTLIQATQLRAGDVIDRPDTSWNVARVQVGVALVFVHLHNGDAYTYQRTEFVRILRRNTEIVEARNLRDGDVIVNSQAGETIPVLLATPYGQLIMIWTDTVNGFVLSPTVTVEIQRRKAGA